MLEQVALPCAEAGMVGAFAIGTPAERAVETDFAPGGAGDGVEIWFTVNHGVSFLLLRRVAGR